VRGLVDRKRIAKLIEELGRRARGPGCVYLTGGATALLYGWRGSTVDVDLKLDPEPAAIFEAIAELKEALDINIELASPDQFIPPVPGWRDRSVHIGRHGEVDFYHFDPLSQALAKLARGHDRDVSDVRAMLERELFGLDDLLDGLAKIQPELLRYPALDASAFLRRVRSFVEDQRG
jgi:hypothetical protein